MTKIDDGGPAFPTALNTTEDGQGTVVIMGMSLRDWFAGRALAGLLAADPGLLENSKARSKAAYDLADAMIAQRKKGINDDGGNGDGEVGGSDEGGRASR